MPASKRSINAFKRTELIRRCVALRREGMSYQEIGDIVGVSKPTAFRYVRSYIEKINEECSEDASMIRSMELERLDVILKHNMKVVENKNGQYRPSEVAKASEVVMKTQERRTKYLGLDSSGDNGVVEVKFVREG
jgi:AcrR family transcriptional regulator